MTVRIQPSSNVAAEDADVKHLMLATAVRAAPAVAEPHGLGLCIDEGALSFVTGMWCPYMCFPYKTEGELQKSLV